MRILVAGASGAIGRRLLPRLAAAGHAVTGISRTDEGLASIGRLGAHAVRCDCLDPGQVHAAVESARPEVIVNQLTNLPHTVATRKMAAFNQANDRIRLEGTVHLLEAGARTGARRFVMQSAAFWYAPAPAPCAETAGFFTACPVPTGPAAEVMSRVDQLVRAETRLEGLCVRYGSFYGAGTWYHRDGDVGRRVRQRAYPLIGGGNGIQSFIHLDDAASATIAVIEHGVAGQAYNAVDDEPARTREWLPVFAQCLGAPSPLGIPASLARLVVGSGVVQWMMESPGASNARLKHELGWAPRYASWREGFQTLG